MESSDSRAVSMSAILKDNAKQLPVKQGSIYAFLQALILEDFFDMPVTSADVAIRIAEKFGKRIRTNHIQTYMRKFMLAGVIHAVKDETSSAQYWVLASMSKKDALSAIKKGAKISSLEQRLFSDKLLSKMQTDFTVELAELHDNFGQNGNCTAFMLRKILEKMLIIAFSKTGKTSLLEDPLRPGGWKGLKEMIEIATREKINGFPLLTGKTANEIKGVKFLGDTAAHNPLVSVDMNTILPQMPYVITAYEELATRL